MAQPVTITAVDSFSGKLAVVTGGGSGIGRAVVDRYVEECAKVAVVDNFFKSMTDTIKAIEQRIDAPMKAYLKKKEDEKPQHPPLKPANPDIKGAPNDHDREAQYEDKDES